MLGLPIVAMVFDPSVEGIIGALGGGCFTVMIAVIILSTMRNAEMREWCDR